MIVTGFEKMAERYHLTPEECRDAVTAAAVYRYKGPAYRRKDQKPLKAALIDLVALWRLARDFRKARKHKAQAAALYAELDTFFSVWARYSPRNMKKPAAGYVLTMDRNKYYPHIRREHQNERSRPDRPPDPRP